LDDVASSICQALLLGLGRAALAVLAALDLVPALELSARASVTMPAARRRGVMRRWGMTRHSRRRQEASGACARQGLDDLVETR